MSDMHTNAGTPHLHCEEHLANGTVLIALWEQEQNVLGLLGFLWSVLCLPGSETYALQIAEPGAGTITNRSVNTSCVNTSLSVWMA